MSINKNKINKGTYVVLLAALGAMTFFGVCSPTGSNGPKGAAATIADETITRDEFNRAYNNIRQRNQEQTGVAASAMQQLVNSRVMYIKAKELGFNTSIEQATDLLLEQDLIKDNFIKDGKFDKKLFKSFLSRNGYTEESYVDMIKREITTSKLRNFLNSSTYHSKELAAIDYLIQETKRSYEYVKFDPQSIQVNITNGEITKYLTDKTSSKEVKSYYDNNQKEFNKPEKILAKHILIQHKNSRNVAALAKKRTVVDAKKLAVSIASMLKAAAKDFDKLAKKYTDDPRGKKTGGSLGWITKDSMPPKFNEIAFNMKAGQISEIVETKSGFHIIKLTSKTKAISTSFEQAKNNIARKLLTRSKRPELAKINSEKFLAALNEKKSSEKELLKKYQVRFEQTGEESIDARSIRGIGDSDTIVTTLSSLKKIGQTVKIPLESRGSYYIVRLKSIKKADKNKVDKKKLRNISRSKAFMAGYRQFSTLQTKYVEDMKDKIWINQSYITFLDVQNNKEK